jgi:hypothetical protein
MKIALRLSCVICLILGLFFLFQYCRLMILEPGLAIKLDFSFYLYAGLFLVSIAIFGLYWVYKRAKNIS